MAEALTHSLIIFDDNFHLVPDSVINEDMRSLFTFAHKAKTDDVRLFEDRNMCVTKEEYDNLPSKEKESPHIICDSEKSKRMEQKGMAPDQLTAFKRLAMFRVAGSYFKSENYPYRYSFSQEEMDGRKFNYGLLCKYRISLFKFNKEETPKAITHIYSWKEV